ncbi:MAG: prolyl oligopeptidase family serine peptidase, partial [Phaeodactylibacter sp.]|nr:prolyl oligopeptidase family serine peptidase [Phaeodactylibacter sp.]
AGNKEWGGKMHFDLVDIADWAVDQGIADPDALGMWGWSYGGYATDAAMVYAPDMFQAGVSMYGPSDLEAFCKLPGIADSPLWINRVGNVNDDQEVQLLRQHSPINFVDRAEAPLLLTTGSKDERVPQEQVDRMAQAYHDAGKEVVYFYYPEEVHDYREPGSWISFWAIAEQFLALNLGGDYQEVGNDLEKGQFEVNFGQDFIEKLK